MLFHFVLDFPMSERVTHGTSPLGVPDPGSRPGPFQNVEDESQNPTSLQLSVIVSQNPTPLQPSEIVSQDETPLLPPEDSSQNVTLPLHKIVSEDEGPLQPSVDGSPRRPWWQRLKNGSRRVRTRVSAFCIWIITCRLTTVQLGIQRTWFRACK